MRWGLRHYVILWLLVTVVMGREYLILNRVMGGASLLSWMSQQGWLLALPSGKKLSPAPGQPLSFMLGWLGFAIIALTNLYILRKRAPFLRHTGAVSSWLDMHIFCGLLGPTLIVFHCNFQVRGLVAVSFWSMVISFLSGVAGRYFYVQLIGRRAELEGRLREFEARLRQVQLSVQPRLTDSILKGLLRQAQERVGVTDLIRSGRAHLGAVIFASITGDLRTMTVPLTLPDGVPRSLGGPLRDYALIKRRFLTDGYYRQIMGYWHTFHLPFAIFMYVVSVIHIIAALVFRVNH